MAFPSPSYRGAGLLAAFALAGGLVPRAEAAAKATTPNPDLTTVNIGTEAPAWTWTTAPTSTGQYGTDGKTFTLTGNGQGVYFCWDRAAVGLVNQAVDGDFDFTARLANLADTGITQVGILVKSGLDVKTPVLSLRWDSFWIHHGSTGLVWFNRQTPSASIGICDKCEKGDMIGTTPKDWEGCLGQGFENRVPGYSSPNGIWMKVRRVGTAYNLYAKHDGDAKWTQISGMTAGSNGGGVPPHEISFALPEMGATAILGIFVVGAGYGNHIVTADFDNISFSDATGGGLPDVDAVVSTSKLSLQAGALRGWRATADGAGIRVEDPGIANRLLGAALFDLSGKRVADLAASPRTGSGWNLSLPATVKSGVYQLRLELAGEGQRAFRIALP